MLTERQWAIAQQALLMYSDSLTRGGGYGSEQVARDYWDHETDGPLPTEREVTEVVVLLSHLPRVESERSEP